MLVVAFLLGGCGDVFADIEVQKQATTEPNFLPETVTEGELLWMLVRARLDQATGTPALDDHGFDPILGVTLAYPKIEFFPGFCPEASDVTEETALEAASSSSSPVDDEGRFVFCAAVRVNGSFDEVTELTVPLEFWDGAQSVTGSAQLFVMPAADSGDASEVTE